MPNEFIFAIKPGETFRMAKTRIVIDKVLATLIKEKGKLRIYLDGELLTHSGFTNSLGYFTNRHQAIARMDEFSYGTVDILAGDAFVKLVTSNENIISDYSVGLETVLADALAYDAVEAG